MKRALLFLIFVLMLSAAWFRWVDEIDPATLKGELQTQAAIFKEKSADFSLKAEVSQVITALDNFFSPPKEEMNATELAVVIPPDEPDIANQQNMEASKTEEPLNSVEEAFVATVEEPVLDAAEQTASLQETPQFSPDPNMGYPAPGMEPVSSTPTNPILEDPESLVIVLEPTEEADQEDSLAEPESPLMEFNQLQETVPGSFLPYNLQSVEPLYTSNFVHPEDACNWMGVAGQIFGEDLEPKDGLIVVVEGAVNNSMVEVLGYSGLAQSYGPGGYELILSQVNKPGIFWVQLFDVKGIPLSGIYSFQMNGTCEQNLAVINFTLKNDAEGKFVPTVSP